MTMPGAQTTYAIVVLVLALTGIGFAGMRAMRISRSRGTSEYFLGGHTVSWIGLAGSFFVTTLWGVWCIGVELSFRANVWMWAGLGVIMAAGFVLMGYALSPVYRARDATTIAEFLADRFGNNGVGVTVSLAFVLLTLLVRIPITIVLGGRMLHLIFGWDPVTAALLMIVVPGVFAVAGGYTAIFAVQGVAAVAAVAGLVFFGNAGAPDITLPSASHFSGTGNENLVLFCGLALYAVWSTCIDQSIVQRVTAARTWRDPRRSAFAAAGAIALGGLAIGIGAASRATSFLPPGTWTGVAAAFVGASIVTSAIAALSGQFMSVSTMTTMDLFRQFRSSADESALVLVGRLTTTIAVIFSILASSVLALIGDAAVVWLVAAYTVLGTPLAAIAIVGFVWPGRHSTGAICGLLAGWTVGCVMASLQPEQMISQNGLFALVIAVFVLSALVMAGVTLLASPGLSFFHLALRKDIRVPKS